MQSMPRAISTTRTTRTTRTATMLAPLAGAVAGCSEATGTTAVSDTGADAATAASATLPARYGDLVFLGAPGRIAAGEAASATVERPPGTRRLQCHVKTGGRFPAMPSGDGTPGMVHEFEGVPAAAPSAQGIGIEGTPAPARSLGEIDDMAGGAVGSFGARFEPGEHARVAEVPDPGVHGMLVPFTMSAP